jgi:hypothetical protein
MLIAGALCVVHSAYIYMTLDSFTNVTVPVENGKTLNFNLSERGLTILLFLKTVGAFMMMKWGCTGVRTFKPILKNLQNE